MPRPSTPTRGTTSTGPPSMRGSGRQTPTAQARTPNAAQRYGESGRKTNALTPHGRAAIREIESRRAVMTPGKDRRRSGRQQRETPRDVLRALSRTLAPKTERIISSPEPTPQPEGRFRIPALDDLDDGIELERPRLSLPLDEDEDDDDDDSLLLPTPQLAHLEEDNFTVQSVEMPRRALNEQPGRYARGSFGSIRLSDRFGDLNDIGSGGLNYDIDSSIIEPGTFEDDVQYDGDIIELPGENSEILARFNLEQRRPFISPGRQSDIRPAVLSDDDSQTFAFTIPQPDVNDEFTNGSVRLHHQMEGNGEDSASEVEVRDAETEEVAPEESLQPNNIRDINEDSSILGTAIHDTPSSKHTSSRTAKKKAKISRHGIKYPSLPAGVVKKLASTFARTGGNSKGKISKEALDAIQQASDWFFEQASEDLGAYAQHAGRKTIDDSDMITLLSRYIDALFQPPLKLRI
ncbi:hypothetical protein PVAG01_08696 [Phlyctema vagabunda]|uniref:CENP-T/Histone H4 histone fold domain-containing protein n=1 Tax=Phlyctema vagabunda TaxID=108571 RepID=A0ABR4PA47_9HELO